MAVETAWVIEKLTQDGLPYQPPKYLRAGGGWGGFSYAKIYPTYRHAARVLPTGSMARKIERDGWRVSDHR